MQKDIDMVSEFVAGSKASHLSVVRAELQDHVSATKPESKGGADDQAWETELQPRRCQQFDSCLKGICFANREGEPTVLFNTDEDNRDAHNFDQAVRGHDMLRTHAHTHSDKVPEGGAINTGIVCVVGEPNGVEAVKKSIFVCCNVVILLCPQVATATIHAVI